MSNLSPLLKLAFVLTFTTLTADGMAQKKDQLLIEAVVRRDTTQVKSLLAAGVDPNAKPKMGMYPLMIAASNDDIAMTKILLKAGANPNVKPTNAGPILHSAQNAPIIKLLLDAKADMYYLFPSETHFESFVQKNLTSEADKKKAIDQLKKLRASNKMNEQMYQAAVKTTETHWQTIKNMTDVVNIYMKKGYDPSKLTGKHKQNVIHKAVLVENYEILHILMKTGKANFSIYPPREQFAICQITQTDFTKRKITEYEALLVEMLKNGATLEDIGRVKNEDGTPLMIASYNGMLDRCQVLIKLGAKVNSRNANQRTPLYFAQKLNVVKFLVEKGADLKAVDKLNQSVMFYKEEADVINFYLSKKLNPNHANTHGETPLFGIQALPAVMALVAGGANVNQLTLGGQSILDVGIDQILEAAKFDKDIQPLLIPKMKYLVEKGMKKELIKKAYATCLSYADSGLLSKVEAMLAKYAK